MSTSDPASDAAYLHRRKERRVAVFVFLTLVFVYSAFVLAHLNRFSARSSHAWSALQMLQIADPTELFHSRILSGGGESEDTNAPSRAPFLSVTISFSDPSFKPTFRPTDNPTVNPYMKPPIRPTMKPTIMPTKKPTIPPSVMAVVPTAIQSNSPTATPSLSPSNAPFLLPISSPPLTPTASPSSTPTSAPSRTPSISLTLSPTAIPSLLPTATPSLLPTATPSASPNPSPTLAPLPVHSSVPSSAPSSLAIGVITTVAGTGTGGYGGDGGKATSAQLNRPTSVVIDASGNVYMADLINHRVRVVVKNTGNIITVAGTGVHGYSGDGGQATAAMLYYPQGIALDSAGNIYIADKYNNCIRMVTKSTGIITTVAGNGTIGYSGDRGPAIAAKLNFPTGVTVDASGNIYIVDHFNYCIRMVVQSTGIISTLAGNGLGSYSGDGGLAKSATLDQPTGVSADSSGNVYIADKYNNCIRMVTMSTGIITTVAGTGMYGFSGDGGLATSANLNYPTGVAVDAAGNIYIADTYNNRIRIVVKSTGVINTVAGTGSTGYTGDKGQATAAKLSNPYGVTIDTSGSIYVADSFNNRIRMVYRSGIPSATSTASPSISFTPSAFSAPPSASILLPPSAPSTSKVAVIQTTQTITGLTYDQASTSSFRIALVNTLASTLDLHAEKITLSNVVISQNRRILLSSISISYSFIVSSSISAAALTSLLDDAVSSGVFATSLSLNSGTPELSVQGTFSTATSSPAAAPVASSTAFLVGSDAVIIGASVGGMAVALFVFIYVAWQCRNTSMRGDPRLEAPISTIAHFADPPGTVSAAAIVLPVSPLMICASPAYYDDGRYLRKGVEGQEGNAVAAWPT